jgi:hypothetical protein
MASITAETGLWLRCFRVRTSPARGDSKILGEVISMFDGSCHGHRAKNGCICSLGVGRTAQY